MADLALANSTYTVGTNDSASTLVNNVSTTDAQQWNGVATGVVGIETILGTGTTLKGSVADLATRLAVLLQASGAIADKDSGTTYTKYDGWLGYGSATLKKLPNMRFPGEIIMSSLTTVPTGWLECNAQSVSNTTYVDLFDMCLAEIALSLPAGYATSGTGATSFNGNTNVNTATDTITITGHTLANTNVVYLATAGTLPTGLTAYTKYYVVNAAANTIKLSTTSGGSAVDITALGSGTINLYTEFKVPDYRGRSPMGAGTGSGLTNRILNTQYGTETHTLTTSEIPSHSHTTTLTANTGSGPNTNWYQGDNGGGSTGVASENTGGGGAHANVHPVFGIKYLVRY